MSRPLVVDQKQRASTELVTCGFVDCANRPANFKFSSTPLYTIVPSSGNPIVNVAPADYDHDGRLDVLVMTQGSSPSSPIEMEVWMGRGRSGLLGEWL